jgi:hypothetical protein
MRTRTGARLYWIAPGYNRARVSWIYALLLAGAIAVLVAAEWPRLSARFGFEERPRRDRRRRKSHLRLVRSESEEFAASVERDLESLPTIEERNGRSS